MKFNDLPKTDKRGREYALENAAIESVSISNEDYGALTAWLNLKIGEYMGCGFGGFMLGKADGDNLSGKGYCAEFLVRCMNTVGRSKWEDLKGCPLRCLTEGLGGGVVAIGHFLEDKWFCPSVEFKGEFEGIQTQGASR